MFINKHKNLFFTLPDNIILDKKIIKLKLSLKIYFYLFFLFRFFIFKESLFLFTSIISYIFDNIYMKKIYIQYNKLKYEKNYFLLNALILKYNLINSNLNIFNNLIIKDFRINIYLSIIIKIKKTFNYWYFFNKKISILLFEDFIFRIPFIFFIAFKTYIYKFKVYKYNEYLKKSSILINYPLIRLILRVNWKTNKILNSSSNIFFLYKLYFDNFLLNSNKMRINIIKKNNIKFLLEKQKILKFLILFNKNTFIFIYNYFKIYFLNIFYLYIYNIWIMQLYVLKGIDYIESYKWNIFYIFHLYWWLYKYNFDLPIWLYILVILQIVNINLQNINIKFNITCFNDIIREKIYSFNNISLCIFKIISIIFIVHFEKIYFKFFQLTKDKNYRNSKFNWKKAWNLIIKYYPIDFIYLPLNYYNNLKYLNKYLDIYVYNLDIIHWKIFYSVNFLDNIINLNITSVLKYINFNNYLQEKYDKFSNNLWYFYKRKENSLMNFLFFYNFNRDLFYKIILKNYLIFNNFKEIIVKYNFIFKNYFFKIILKKLLHLHSINFILSYRELNRNLFNVTYDKYICIIIYVIFIKKYTK